MPTPDLISICASSFLAVFLLLSVLALIMRLILIVFPDKEVDKADPAYVGAIATVYQTLYPGTRITKVEEIK